MGRLFKNLVTAGQVMQFFPLSAFVLIAFWHGKPQTNDWFIAFLCGGALSLLQIASFLVWLRDRPLNRLSLSVNIYLIIGALGVSLGWIPLLRQFDMLRESGVFLCLLGTGLVTSFFSPAGFAGSDCTSNQARVRRSSAVLLAITIAGLALSFRFRGHFLLSAGIPLFALGISARYFRRRLRTSAFIASEDAPL